MLYLQRVFTKLRSWSVIVTNCWDACNTFLNYNKLTVRLRTSLDKKERCMVKIPVRNVTYIKISVDQMSLNLYSRLVLRLTVLGSSTITVKLLIIWYKLIDINSAHRKESIG